MLSASRVRNALVVGFLVVSGFEPVSSQDLPDLGAGAVECCLQLLFPVGARAVGLGNALTARSGPDALFVNPAGLARLRRDEFRIHNADTELESSNAFALAFRIRGAGVLGLSYRLIDYGESQATDIFGNPTGTLRSLEHFLVATFATVMSPGLAAGISYRIFQFRHDCSGFCEGGSFAATTHAVDLGMQYHPGLWPALQLGASLTHLGVPLQVLNAEQADPTPTRVRAGAAYELMHHFSRDTTTAIWASMDVSGSWRAGVETRLGGGLELILDETIFVRAGYAMGRGRDAGAGVGVGLRYDRFELGIARSFVGAASGGQDPFQITFAVGF
ncbi:hypothetical protein BH23GEM9_BH23GEM9_05040 [soil metagenome]